MSLIAENPARAVWWAKQESSITNAKITNGGTFRNDRPSYAQMLAFTQAQADAVGKQGEAQKDQTTGVLNLARADEANAGALERVANVVRPPEPKVVQMPRGGAPR